MQRTENCSLGNQRSKISSWTEKDNSMYLQGISLRVLYCLCCIKCCLIGITGIIILTLFWLVNGRNWVISCSKGNEFDLFLFECIMMLSIQEYQQITHIGLSKKLSTMKEVNFNTSISTMTVRLLHPQQNCIISVLQEMAKMDCSPAKNLGWAWSFNRPFPSCCELHYESKAKCKPFHMKTSLIICIWMKTNFHNKIFCT